MPIQMQCPQCQAKAALPDGHAGRPVRCKRCNTTFAIPPDAGAKPGHPAVIDRYLVRELLGEGSFVAVYRAFDPRLERDVALKVLRPEMMTSAQAVERFLREAKAAAKLLHPNIVPVYDTGRSGSVYYIASAFIKGMTLASAIPEEGGVEPRRAVKLAAQLASALGYAHRQGILHRDVKPANAMVNEQELLHLMDFGLAGWTQEESTRLTRLGAVMGTPAYMAPEQASGNTKLVGPASDLYSAGVVLYELLTSRRPFEGGHPAALAYLIVHTQPTPPSQHKPELDARLEAICLKALAKKPEDRFASGEDMAAALAEWTPTATPMVLAKAMVAPPTLNSPKETMLPSFGLPIAGPLTTEAAPRPSIFARETVVPVSLNESTLGFPPASPTLRGWQQGRRSDGRRNWALGGGLLLAVTAVLLFVLLSWLRMFSPQTGAEQSSNGTTAHLEPPPTTPNGTDEITNGLGMKLKLIKAGAFKMGSPDSDKNAAGDEKPQHEVEITNAFYMGSYPVTVGQFAAFVKDADYKTEAETDGLGGAGYDAETRKFEAGPKYTWRNPGFAQTDAHPVVNVSWNDAAKFCEWLSQKEKMAYRLPSEAQWEYACRAGTTTAFSFGDNSRMVGDFAWYGDNAEFQTHSVGGKKANRWGLFDMQGNVWQWCADNYDEKTYQNSPIKDPNNTLGAAARVLRGGSWYNQPKSCRSASRYGVVPGLRSSICGCRVVMLPAEPLIAANQATISNANSDKVDSSVAATQGEKLADDVTNGAGMKLLLIKPGKFMMGSPNDEAGRQENEGPRHEVELTRPFYMGAYSVTRGQFAAFVKDADYKTEAETNGKGGVGYNGATRKFELSRNYTWRNPGFVQTDEHPVVSVSWNDAVKFCEWLSRKEGKTYGLPTEAQWEYACRAATTTAYSFGDDPQMLGNYAWTLAKANNETHSVDDKRPNAWGLFDMHGNGWQWCADYYDEKYYQNSPTRDPQNVIKTNACVVRGDLPNGNGAASFRSAVRIGIDQGYSTSSLGLRVVMLPNEPQIAAKQTPVPIVVPVKVDPPPPQNLAIEIADGVGMKLKLIKPGSFMMGSPKDEKGRYEHEGPQHAVELTRPFYMSEYPVTRGQFDAFVKAENYKTEAETNRRGGVGYNADTHKYEQARKYTWRHPGFVQTDAHPVVNVSWNDAMKYCEWLSQKEKKTYCLPTEAQWEYASRAGTATVYSFGDNPLMIGDFDWYLGNSAFQTHPVGRKKPNR